MKMTLKTLVMIMALGLAFTAGAQAQDPCKEFDNGTGTVTLPPQGCSYMTADDVHAAIDSLDPNTTIILAPIHTDFICRKLGQCGTPGGSLGGEVENFTSTGVFTVVGTGQLAGFSRTIAVPLTVETHTAKRVPGSPVQSFKTDMARLQGQITGDPDFAALKITAGTANGFPSPGHTTLTKIGGGQFLVDSFFDIQYEISFQGAPGGKLDGFGGTSQGKVRMQAVKKCD